MLALTSPARSQAELLFQEFAGERSLQYVSLLAPDESELQDIVAPGDGRAIDLDVRYCDPQSVLEDPSIVADTIPKRAYVILDAVDPLERAPMQEYLSVLNSLKSAIRKNDGLAVLHSLKEEPISENRSLTLKRADHVWDIQLATDRSEITTRLCITKSRANQILPEPLPLELIDGVRIDTSRSIA